MISEAAIGGLARIDALHTGLTQIVLEGGDLVGIADEVSRALDVGVLVTSTDGRQRAAALSDGQWSLLEAHDLVEPTGRSGSSGWSARPRPPARGRCSGCGWRRAAPTWRAWSASGSTGRSPPTTYRPSSGPPRWPRC